MIHADIPGSLENYLQEAGRAGRDNKAAHCVLLYDVYDINTQFTLSSSSRLTRRDISQILKGLRKSKKDKNNTIVITSGEILRDDDVTTRFTADDRTATTKVNTAVAVLERSNFIERNENQTNVIQVKPLMPNLEDALKKIEELNCEEKVKRQWKEIMKELFLHDANKPISVDDLAGLPSMALNRVYSGNSELQHDTLPVLKVLKDMVQAGLVKKDTFLSAYVKVRCTNSSSDLLSQINKLETDMIDLMNEEEPDPEGWIPLNLRHLNHRLLDSGHSCAPESLLKLLRSLAKDGQGLAGQQGSIAIKPNYRNDYKVKIQRSWSNLRETADRRRNVAAIILKTIVEKVPKGSNGQHLVEFSESDLMIALKSDLILSSNLKDPASAIERGLLYLHEQGCIILQQGLAIFRSAMTIKILPSAKGRRYTEGDFSSLKEHYRERIFQIHVMGRYALLGLDEIKDAMNLILAYFTMEKVNFVKQYFPGDEEKLERATSAESYKNIVDSLNNSIQISVVSAKVDKNILVLAGPGSGKTRVIAHRCAYLLRVERVRPREILVLCFNRAALTSLKKRIIELVGGDAYGLTVQTYHGLAMRLAGFSIAAHSEQHKEALDLDSLIPKATAMLRGECDITGFERDEIRERLLAGYRHILIDEYQDIDEKQYEMISAIAGRTLDSASEDSKLNILAVGDDDQSIYAFRGTNVRFIHQFEKDYNAERHYLVENYRSTRNIIEASNKVIAQNRDRMKTNHPIHINKAREHSPPGEKVHIVRCLDAVNQARHILKKIKTMKRIEESVAVLSWTNDELHIIRAALKSADIPTSIVSEHNKGFPLHRLREFQAIVSYLRNIDQNSVKAEEIRRHLQNTQCNLNGNPWQIMMDNFLIQWAEETRNCETTPAEVIDYLYEAQQEYRRFGGSDNPVYLSTVYAAKGLEFDHVFILGNWKEQQSVKEQEEERRPYYVGMTRARKTLHLYSLKGSDNPHTSQLQGKGIEIQDAGILSEPSESELNLSYSLLDLKSVWIDYPVLANNSDKVRNHISKLQPGMLVSLKKPSNGNRIYIMDSRACMIGKLSKEENKNWQNRFDSVRSVHVHAIINWPKIYSNKSTDKYPDDWEVPLFEVVWSKSRGTK